MRVHSTFLAVVCALASALTIAWGTAARHQVATNTSLKKTLRSPLWWAGLGTSLLAYILQLLALGFGTLLVVQPILVLSLMFTLPMAAHYAGRRATVKEMLWAGLLTASVGILVFVGQPTPGIGGHSWHRWVAAIGLGAVLLSFGYVYAQKQIRKERALLLGLITGAIMGYLAVFAKSVATYALNGELYELLTSWQFYGLLLAALLGTASQQIAFRAGALKNSLAGMKIGEPIVASLLGYVVLGEHFQASGSDWIWMVAASIIIILATFYLSRSTP